MQPQKKELQKTKAYKLFLEELDKHVVFARTSFLAGDIVPAKACSEAGTRFHNIKGGAGFFGFDDLASRAASLEKIFKKPLEDLVCEMDRARQIILELESLITELPQPNIENSNDKERGQ